MSTEPSATKVQNSWVDLYIGIWKDHPHAKKVSAVRYEDIVLDGHPAEHGCRGTDEIYIDGESRK